MSGLFAEFTIKSINWAVVWTALGVIVAAALGIAAVLNRRKRNAHDSGRESGATDARLTSLESGLKDVKKEITETRKDLTQRIDNVLLAVAGKGLAESNSPRQLNSEGRKVLESSGINTVVDDRFDYIVEQVRKRGPQNPYQAEQAILSVVNDFVNDPVLKDAIEEGAFRSGYLVPSVLFVGGLYIRDRVLEALGMRVDDIDQHDPNNGK